MLKIFVSLAFATLAVVAAPSVLAQESRQELAVAVVEAHNAPELIIVQIEESSPEIVDAFRASVPDLTEPEGDMIVSYFMEEMRALMPQFTQEFAAIYAAHLTGAELQELLENPNTTLDGRLTEVQPAIAEQANALGERYGQQAMTNALPRINELLENR